MEDILQSTDTKDSPLIKRFADQKLTCTNYEKLSELLAESLFDSDYNHKLFVDWSFTFIHPLIFDIDVKPSTRKNNTDLLMSYIHSVFLYALKKYLCLQEITLILAMRRNKASGFHIHVVDVDISHDDYIYLWDKMQSDCFYREGYTSVYLNCPSRFALPASDEPEGPTSLYVPIRVLRVRFILCDLEEIVLRQQEEKEFFDQVVYHPAQWKTVARAMMPLSQPKATLFHYATRIVPGFDPDRVAEFSSILNQCSYSLIKNENLTRKHKRAAFCYEFLKSNAPQIVHFKSKISVLETWYHRFQMKESPLSRFQNIDQDLRKWCPHLKTVHSPLLTVLQTYEKPVYFALVNLTQDMDAIYREFPTLPKYLYIPEEASRLTFETILYLAYKVSMDKSGNFACMAMGWDWIFASTKTLQEMLEHVRFFQRKLFPIVKGNGNIYFWDSITEKWCKIISEKEDIELILDFTVRIMERFEGYDKIPFGIRQFFEHPLSQAWIKPMIQNISSEIEKLEPVKVNSMRKPFRSIYGCNVPEYYFLEKRSNEDFCLENEFSESSL